MFPWIFHLWSFSCEKEMIKVRKSADKSLFPVWCHVIPAADVSVSDVLQNCEMMRVSDAWWEETLLHNPGKSFFLASALSEQLHWNEQAATLLSGGLNGTCREGRVLDADLLDGSHLNSEIQLIHFAKSRTDFEPLFILHYFHKWNPDRSEAGALSCSSQQRNLKVL